MADQLHRFLLENLHVRGEYVKLETAWQDILQTTFYPKPIRDILGEATAAIALLAASLKFKGSLTLQMNNTYPVNMFVVQAKSDGSIRAIARWKGDIDENARFNDLFVNSPTPDDSSTSKQGTLIISVEQEDNTERYQSIIALDGDNLADILATYFKQSEQLSTYFSLSTSTNSVAGLMLQSLPSEKENSGWNHAHTLAQTVTKDELLNLNVETLLHRLYHEEEVRLFDPEALYFACSCSQQKIENMIRSLGEVEANSVIKEQGSIQVDCQFCNQHYSLDTFDVKRIFTELGNPGTGSVH